MRRLIAGADVLVQNFRPGLMERLGLGEPAMRALNPGLVYVSISGVGDTGPYVKKRVYDPVIQSLSGLADVQADQQTGRPQMIRTIVADKTTAVYAAQAVCAALVARGRPGERFGQGQHIRLSMLDTMVAFLWPEAMTQYTVVGREDAPQPAPRPDLIFQTLDGYITVGSLSDAEWRGLCEVHCPAGMGRRSALPNGLGTVGECSRAPGVGGRDPGDRAQPGLAGPARCGRRAMCPGAAARATS